MTPKPQLELGELEFKAEDSTDPDWDRQHKITIRQANAILRDKLEKAPMVYGIEDKLLDICKGGMKWTESGWVNLGKDKRLDTHEARLVCIHPLTERESGE